MRDMDSAQRDRLLASPAFARLVSNRWRVSLTLTVLLFVMYYGYIVLIAVNKPFMARRLGDVTPIGVPLGVAVILGSWFLTALYIVWANRWYDPEVARLRGELERR
jgi:uncharacterized membrane protein (DUF485 family)